MKETIDYENIYFYRKEKLLTGKIKFASSGVAFKESKDGSVTTIPADEVKRIEWVRSARDYQIRLIGNDLKTYKFDGFPREGLEELRDFAKDNYSAPIDIKELSVKGWNWGNIEMQNDAVSFNVSGKPMLEIPLSDVTNTILPSKTELALELGGKETVGHVESLAEIRFYVPGTGEDENMQNANSLYQALKTATESGSKNAGDALASFSELSCVIPRGRYEFDMFSTFLRLRGKSYDYKILYSSIVKFFLLPKPDDIHIYFVIGLDPPIRQGQTRYPFIVLQFDHDDELSLDVNVDEELNASKFEGKLNSHYEGQTFEVVSAIFRAVTQKKITIPGTYKSSHQANAVKCSLKANEGLLYPLEKSFLFLPKPTLYMPYTDVVTVEFSRVSGSISNSRSFDMKVSMKSGTDYQFSSIPKEEFVNLEEFLKNKKLKIKNIISADERVAMQDDYDSESDSDVGEVRDSDDSESEDNDFNAESSDDDVAEEYDEHYASEGEDGSGEGKASGNPSDDIEDDEGSNEEEEEVKVVKPKSSKPKEKPAKEAKQAKRKNEEASTKEGTKRQKKQKDKNAPKRALTAFMYFTKENRAKIASENPGAKFGDIQKLVGQAWKDVQAEEKEKYMELEKQDKLRYQQEISAYKSKTAGTSEPISLLDDDEEDQASANEE